MKINYLEFHCFSLSFILLKISRLETPFFLSLCVFPVGRCACHFCVLLFMLRVIFSKNIYLSTWSHILVIFNGGLYNLILS